MRLPRALVLPTIFAGLLALHGAALPAPAAAQRWDLRDLYPSVEAWTASYKKTLARANALEGYKDTLGRDAASMLAALSALSDVQREAVRLSVYAGLNGDEDLRVARAQERRQQMRALWAHIGEKTAWLAPTVVALGDARVRGFIAAEPALRQRFDLLLDDTLRNAGHTLNAEGEALLAAAGPVLGQPQAVFQQMSDAELPQGSVTLSTGKVVTMNPASFEANRTTAVRADRKRVFDTFFANYKRAEGSFGANLTGQVLGDVFSARARKFDNSLDAALFADNMPPAVYRTLVEQAHAGLPTLQRYLKLRKKMLGITDELAYYDNYPPLVPAPKGERWDLTRSKAMSLAALAPLGDEYLGQYKRLLDSNWIDSHPRPGKTSGAYMSVGAYDVHPYLLLNHNDDFESLSTLAHEGGHAVHTLLSNAAQPFDKSGYSTFIAESASIANEMLLSDYMVAHAKTRDEKLYYLSQGLESIRTTFFRQVMFAEFQLAMHEEVEQGRPLSGARLSDLYCGLVKRYYGEAEGVMKVDPAYCVEWAYVGHFYRGYYVWQYATSMVGAAEFTQAILTEGAPARERFVDLLKAGNSDYAYKLYVKAGVDLARPAPYQALIARMNRLMDEFEKLAATSSTISH
jgi:oligoendopeptidase F